MACLTVPLAEAVLVTVAKKVLLHCTAGTEKCEAVKEKITWLEKMLYGGSFLLAVEHIYHGELSFVPPFLTAMRTPEEIPAMLHEMATVGVGMAVLTTAVWGIVVGISLWRSKRKQNQNPLCVQGGLA